jgi:hypothetical protein
VVGPFDKMFRQPLMCNSDDTYQCFLPLVKTREFSRNEQQPILQSVTIARVFHSSEVLNPCQPSSTVEPITDLDVPHGVKECPLGPASPPPQTLAVRPRLRSTELEPTPCPAPESIPKPKGPLARPARGGYSLQAELNLPEKTYRALQVSSNAHEPKETSP